MAVGVRTVVTGPWRENCYLVSDPDGNAVIIDPGDEAESIAPVIEEAGLAPRAILATHGHHDHVGAAAWLRERYGVPFYLHSGDEKLLSRTNFYRKLFDRAKPVEITPVDEWLDATPELHFGGLDIRVLHTPGHTPGGVSFAIDGRLFSGDLLLKGKVGRVDLPGGDRDTLAASLRGLAELPPDTALHPGHGEPTTLSAELASNAQLREILS